MVKHRRWPHITTVIIVINLLVFVLSHARLQREAAEHLEIESRTVSLSAAHPQTAVTSAQQALIEAFRSAHPQDWDAISSLAIKSADAAEVEQEMSGLAQRLDAFQRDSLTAHFAIYPLHRSFLSSLTANFLHRDWIHLLFTCCFLWLVAGSLEDVWGRPIFAGMAFVCGILGIWAYTAIYPGSLVPLVGANGLLAALMGVYVIRFPKTTIERGTALWVVRSRLLRFSSPVYIVFPAWILGMMFWGKSASETTNASYWAQAVAFVAGATIGLVLWLSGVEHYVTQTLGAEEAWSVDAHIASASEYLQSGDLDAAINAVNAQIDEKPTSVEAHEMLVSLYFRKGNALIKYLQALESLCEVHLMAAHPEAAWQDYENYLKAGGRKMPATTWFQLARFAENQADWERAINEYEEFARSWPEERSSVLAMISAARIHLQQFGRREEALRLYTAAQNSRVPHADWDDMIQKGLEKAGGAASKVETISSDRRPPQSK